MTVTWENLFGKEENTEEKKVKEKDHIQAIMLTDAPSGEDTLNIEDHITGLSNFLVQCQSPMTVSIQGEWGTGKSSVMLQVKQKIEEEDEALNIWFDTWQFSQFSFDKQLPVILLSQLVSKISSQAGLDNSQNKKTMFQTMKGLQLFSLALNDLVNHFSGINAKEYKEEMEFNDLYKQIDELKDNFRSLVKDVNKRIIIYIDDLDRLEPDKAVELLEVLKIFLDVDGCVFVLAIDYDVVVRGIASKYHFDMNNKEELEKGKNFFDKIIQVPYTVPVDDYKYERLVQSFIENEELAGDNEKYTQLLLNSVGKNPRSIKRILNTFKLNQLIKKPAKNDSLGLFMMICMQNAYPNTYVYLNTTSDLEGYLKRLADLRENNINLEKIGLDKEDFQSELKSIEHIKFLGIVKDIIKEIDSNRLENIINISENTFIRKKSERSKLKEYQSLTTLLDSDVNDLDSQMTYSIDNVKYIKEKIEALSDKWIVEIVANKNMSVVVFRKRKNETPLIEIKLGKNSFSVMCRVGDQLKNHDEILAIKEKYALSLTKKNDLTFNVMKLNLLNDSDALNDLLKVIDIILSSQQMN